MNAPVNDMDRIAALKAMIDAERDDETLARRHGELRDLYFELGEAEDVLVEHHLNAVDEAACGTPYPWENDPRVLGIYGNRSA